MNDTDLDIILAIADCQLTGQEKQDALEHIASDPELSAELASQIAALEGLGTIGAVSMTASERATLRSNLREQLHLAPAAPVVVASHQRRPWWQPALGLASAAALLIAIVAVPSMFSGSDDSSAEIVADAPENTTVQAAASGQTGATIAIPEVAPDGVVEFFAASDNTFDPTTRSSTVAEAETSSEDESGSPEEGLVSGDEDTDGAFDSDVELLGTPLVTFETEQVESCLTSVKDALPPGELVAHAATTSDEGDVIHFGITTVDGIDYVVSVDVTTCSIVDIGG